MNVEMIEIVLLGTVGVLQFIHYANIGVIIAYAHEQDDNNSREYDEWNSKTVEASYMSAYVILTATFSLFGIAYLILMKFLKKKIPPLIETLVLLGLAMFQWTIGILIAIYVSEKTSPIGPHEDSAPDSDKFDTEWNTSVANTILTFLFNIPITIALLLRAIKALSDGRGTLPGAESMPSDRPPSITRESPQLRETLASHHPQDSRANNPQPNNLYSNPPPSTQQQYQQPPQQPSQQYAQQPPQQYAHHQPQHYAQQPKQEYAQQPPQPEMQTAAQQQQSPNPHPQPNPYTGGPPQQQDPNVTDAPMARDTFRSGLGESPTSRGDQL